MKINGYDFTIGADPEFFVKRFGKLVSAHGLIAGTKEAPMPVKYGAVQVDGMALEFNIDPAADFKSFERNMVNVLGQITAMVPGYEVFIEPVAEFGLEYLSQQSEEAQELGCNPDFNAYTKTTNPRPDPKMPFRTASGHVHIGWHKEPVDPNDPNHLEACYALTKTLDLFIGAPSLLWDKDDKRRQLYGQAGAFRPKSYGMEYRVLSNKWIDNPLWRKFVYHNTLNAIEACFNNPEIGNRKFMGVTARQILEKTEDWDYALNEVFLSGVVPSPKNYV